MPIGRRLVPLLLLAAAACGDDPGAGTRRPEPGPYVAQEVWITYHDPRYEKFGQRTGRPRDEALALAKALRAKVLAGADIGRIAQEHSNANGGAALGFSYWIAEERGNWEGRGPALAATRIGDVTEIIDWKGGFWFARRVSEARGKELDALFRREQQRKAKIAAIYVAYEGLDVLDEGDTVTRTKEQALRRAEEALRRALAGEDFAVLVKNFSDHVATRERGGAVIVKGPDGKETDWIRPQQPWIEPEVLDAAFHGEDGKVFPKVLDTARGLFIVKVLERVD
jgi:hypothetical protein